MSFSVNWNGEPIQNASSDNLRSNKAGTFLSSKGVVTYFPLPMFFNKLVPIVRKYKVPSAYANRPDLIAKELYDSEDLWWLVYWSNNTIDPFVGPITGEIISVVDIIEFKKLFNK